MMATEIARNLWVGKTGQWLIWPWHEKHQWYWWYDEWGQEDDPVPDDAAPLTVKTFEEAVEEARKNAGFTRDELYKEAVDHG